MRGVNEAGTAVSKGFELQVKVMPKADPCPWFLDTACPKGVMEEEAGSTGNRDVSLPETPERALP